MRLSKAFLLPEGGAISLVGGGGKSTLMLRLAHELAQDHQRVVVATTTQILRAQGEAAGFLLLDGDERMLRNTLATHPVVCIAALSAMPEKLSAPTDALLRSARTLAHWVIAEADGSRMLPIKAPAIHEPVLLDESFVIAVAGLSALGQPIAQCCQRPLLACKLLGVDAETPLTPMLLAKLITSSEGQLKKVGDSSKFRVVLNQADHLSTIALGQETAACIQRYLPNCRVVLTALQEADCIKGVF